MKTEVTRINVGLTRELDNKLEMWADRLGISKSKLSSMSIMAGLDAILRAVSPVDSVTPAQWAAIIKEMERQGITVDGLKIASEDLPDDK